MHQEYPISSSTWNALVSANERAVQAGWAAPGIFGTGIGPSYRPGGILWVGKSAGPLGSVVGSTHSQAESMAASTAWMVQRRNRRSAFWQMAERLDSSRQTLAWTNISKMDRVGGNVPPKPQEWAMIAEECKAALIEEIESLKPGISVFATSGLYADAISDVLRHFRFEQHTIDFDDRWTRVFRNDLGYLLATKHPQGWAVTDRDRVVQLIVKFQRDRQA